MNVALEAPPAVAELTRVLEGAGYETWAVGGAVRDAIQGLRKSDWDLATRARPEQVRRLFRRTVPIGIEHGTVGVFGSDGVLYEVTTFRRDVEPMGRRAVVSYSETLEEDLSRRDFTINAIAWHPVRKEVRDPFGGLHDLEARVLRAVGTPEERFREDYLRVLRGLRFAGVLELTVDPATWTGLVDAVPGLDILSPERVRDELLKVMEGRRPSGALLLYRDAGVLKHVHPELEPPSGDSPFAVVDAVKRHRKLLRVAAFFHEVLPRSSGEGAEAVFTGLRFSNAEVKTLARLMMAGPTPPDPEWPTDAARRRWMAAVGRPWLRSAMRIWLAGVRARPPGDDERDALEVVRAVRRDLAGGTPLTTAELPVSGSDLMAIGLEPGPAMGDTLRSLLDRVWEEPGMCNPDSLLQLARRLGSG